MVKPDLAVGRWGKRVRRRIIAQQTIACVINPIRKIACEAVHVFCHEIGARYDVIRAGWRECDQTLWGRAIWNAGAMIDGNESELLEFVDPRCARRSRNAYYVNIAPLAERGHRQLPIQATKLVGRKQVRER